MLKHTYQALSILAIIFLVVNYIIWPLYADHGYKWKKGDPLVAPHYKKTLYCNEEFIEDFDFNPFFEDLQEKLKEDQTIKFYKWYFYYSEETDSVYEAELVCVYKIGAKRCKLRFKKENVFFNDKLGVVHISQDLIRTRQIESVVIGNIVNKDISSQNQNNATEVFAENGRFLGYNVKTGFIQYEFIFTDE